MDNVGDIKKKALSGLFWNLSQKITSQVISFSVSVVLARLLSPDEFGLVAMTAIFLSIASVFASSGLGSSLVQKKEIDELDCNTVFYAGLVLSIFVYTILFVTAPFIASLYNQPKLIWILRVQGIVLLFSSISSVQNAMVSRKLDFKQFFKRSLFSTVSSSLLGIYLALVGYGYWALIAQSLCGAVVGIVTMNRIVKWVPRLQFSFKRLKILYGFGLNLTAANLFGSFFNHLRNFLIGLRYSPADLAYSNRGSSIPQIVDGNIRGSITSILFPAMSRLQDDKETIKASMRRSMMLIMFLIAPMMILLSAISDKLIIILYSSKWLQAIPFMQIICFQYLFNIISDSNLQAINAIGRSDITIKLEFVKKPIYLMIVLYTVNISPLAMTLGWTVYAFIAGIINSIPNKRLINYRYIEQVKDIAPQIILSVLMGVFVYFIGFWDGNIYVVILVQVIVGLSFYFSLAFLFNFNSMQYLLKTISSYKR